MLLLHRVPKVQRELQVLKEHKVIKVPQELVLRVLQDLQVLKVQQDPREHKVLQELQVLKVHKDIKEILDQQEHKEMLVLDHTL